MLEKLSELWTNWSTKGLKFPFLYDPVNNAPSITLMFAYITFLIAVISTICLHVYASILTATLTSIFFWVLAVIFYMLRKLHKAKIDVDSKSIELDSGEEEK